MSEKTSYVLQSLVTGQTFQDPGWMLEAPGVAAPGLIRAIYEKKQLKVKDDGYGLYKYSDWIPVCRFLEGSSAPVTYRSEGLARELGLENLFITFSGYWPERGAMMRTCSFKETEAYSVCARLDPDSGKVLVVASAGNTARSFARVCSDNDIPLLLCVPEDNIDALWFGEPVKQHVRLIVSRTGSDYYDAIHLSNIVCKHPRFIAEGGARNVARRDGMGTTVLSAVGSIGRIPDYYFQAVGSGTGAIAAWESNLRLIKDGRYGQHKMKLMVSQNAPFAPIAEAWRAGSRDIFPMDEDVARRQVEIILAKVLSNRKPPYSLAGGLYDALVDSQGDVLVATNEEALAAGRLFEETEGIDLHPAASVATASLIQAVNDRHIDPHAVIMLNITGGGEERFKRENTLYYLKPSLVFDIHPDEEEVLRRIGELFA
ncbi:MAG: cysteate synthase [Bacteroidales bacterium]|nr:cysteate synthase [Bacteroidales bacterium]